jgi:hypothetical protein
MERADAPSGAPAGGIDFLSGLLSRLQTVFGAVVLDARDELDGSIVVDVQLEAGRALQVYRAHIRNSVHDQLAMSALLVETSASLVGQTGALVERLRLAREQRTLAVSNLRELRARLVQRRDLLRTTGFSSSLSRAGVHREDDAGDPAASVEHG